MKFSIVSTFLLAQGIAAMPWSTVKTTQSNGEEITLRIKVSGASSPRFSHLAKPNGSVNPKHYPICFAICLSNEPECPPTWHSVKQGEDDDAPCWTCCKDGSDGNGV
ncbi:hypothetical protein KAF25_008670 [Fusarium avenaceum]|uniref:Pathogenicity protein n=1 Tax=Fusarium avenaceum TaxID=40199 RepID=A0A9P7KZV5_9HYPO|nr:hypothetical protein KAF25_008670 [Fusarium avenaceum]